MATPSAAAETVASAASAGGMRKNGKQWHETKKAFRPTAGQTSYQKRMVKESQAAEVKKIEKEMKAEKEEERQVSVAGLTNRENPWWRHSADTLFWFVAEDPEHQRPPRGKGGEGEICQTCGEDASQASGTTAAPRKAEQAAEIVNTGSPCGHTEVIGPRTMMTWPRIRTPCQTAL